MIQRENPTLFYADAGTLRVAISPESARHQVYGGKIESQSAKLCRENNFLALLVVTPSDTMNVNHCSRNPPSP